LISVVEATPPNRPLYRVGRKPDPRVLPPLSVVGGQRFVSLLPGRRWLDLRAPETCEVLRPELADVLLALGMADFDVSGARGPSRELTQRISRWAFDRGFAGIAYRSRVSDDLDCWAIFEGGHWGLVGRPVPIRRNNPELRLAARLLGLII